MSEIEKSKPVVERRLVRLVQCGRRSCSYVLSEDERGWTPNDYGGQKAICPKCGEDGFYTLKENGQKASWGERDQYRDGIDPTLIEPTPRMGPKFRAALLDAKRRIMEANASVMARLAGGPNT